MHDYIFLTVSVKLFQNRMLKKYVIRVWWKFLCTKNMEFNYDAIFCVSLRSLWLKYFTTLNSIILCSQIYICKCNISVNVNVDKEAHRKIFQLKQILIYFVHLKQLMQLSPAVILGMFEISYVSFGSIRKVFKQFSVVSQL